MLTENPRPNHEAKYILSDSIAKDYYVLPLALLLSGCARSPEDAKKDLSDKKIQYNEQSFVKAVEDQNMDVVELFIEAGMSPNVTTANGSPVVTAAASGNLEIVKLLVEKGADINSKSKVKGELTPLFAAILGNGKEKEKQDTIKFLLDKGADVNARFISKDFEATPLLSQGADVNKKAKNNATALSLAKQENNKEMMSVLTNAGAK
ncbi:MAG: Ankyrin repeat (3 copies) [Firmicutes bacterium]|nr:Ankyrin repeat (3 copies) [Bacillota bacterium]